MTSTLQAITLACYPFKDRANIIKVFSKEQGILSLLVKGISPKHSEKISLCSPLSLSEIIYKQGRQDLHLLLDVKLIDLHLQVREKLDSICSCLGMCKTLLQTQKPEKPSTLLFDLFANYIKKISKGASAKHYELSFRLKTLFHDGNIHLSLYCSLCKNPANCIYSGESFCPIHALENSLHFTDLEWKSLYLLTYSRKHSEIEKGILSQDLEKKINILYKSAL